MLTGVNESLTIVFFQVCFIAFAIVDEMFVL